VWVPHGLTQAELGQLVGGSREPVNKVLSEFASRGWVRLETRTVVLLDLPASLNAPAPPAAEASHQPLTSRKQPLELTAAGPAGASRAAHVPLGAGRSNTHRRRQPGRQRRLTDSDWRESLLAHRVPAPDQRPDRARAARAHCVKTTKATRRHLLARTTTVQLIDDIDGSPAAETVRFAVDGRTYEIDLSTEHAEGLRHSLAQFVAVARRAGRIDASSRRGQGRHGRPPGADSSAVRAWAN